MIMTRTGKTMRQMVQNPAHHSAFARLDAILARSILSDIEKIDRLRRAVFGRLPEDCPPKSDL
jgi:hypothetical protein